MLYIKELLVGMLTKHRLSKLSVASLAVLAAGWFLWAYGNRHNFFDLRIYASAIRWWAEGGALYDYSQPDQVQGFLYFTYPPAAAILLYPLGLIPFTYTVLIISTVSAFAFLTAIWWLVAPISTQQRWQQWFVLAVSAPLLMLMEPIRENFTFGQISMILAALVTMDMCYALPRDKKWTGVATGLATALKLYPGIFVLYFIITRRWRAALMSIVSATLITLLAAFLAPQESWTFWTNTLWDTDRVGRLAYTGNQSLMGLISRAVAPQDPNRLFWLLLVAVILLIGVWKASRAAGLGDHISGLALMGLVGSLIAPITWSHHVFWFIPAILVLLNEGISTIRASSAAKTAHLRPAMIRGPLLIAVAVLVYVGTVFGTTSFIDFEQNGNLGLTPSVEFLLRNLYVVLAVGLLLVLPPARNQVSRQINS